MSHSTPIGEILQINRYPVKSFSGETLYNVSLESYGLYGDRCYSFVNEKKEGWDRYITARQIPEMLRFKAEINKYVPNLEFPEIKVIGSDGRLYQWDEKLLHEIQYFSNDKVSMERHSLKTSEKLAVDDGSVLMITTSTLKKLEQLLDMSLDPRRFRANFVISLYDESLDESDFIDKRLVIGNAELNIQSFCRRCSMITIDPNTLEREPVILKKIYEEMNLNFGLYANVGKAGTIHVGDRIYLSE